MDQQELHPIDAKVAVSLLNNNMVAFVTVAPPRDGGRPLGEEMIREALAFRGVTAGILEDRLAQLAAQPQYDTDVEIARGLPPQDGENGQLTFLFQRETQLKPKELSDGTVDYRELGLVRQAEEGQVLMTKTPATPGTEGYTVLGVKLAPRRGREVVFPAGKNTAVSPDGLQLLAAKAGQIEMVGARVSVLDTFIIKSDVSSATGNINFHGNVLVAGSVLAGFTVQATGNIQVQGACEACTLIADGNITIGEGINGGSVQCKGTLKSKYLQNCQVMCTGSVYSGGVIHCHLNCGESLVLQGSRGTLVGGSCSVASSIEAMFIGSQNTHIPTRVEVGQDPVTQSRLQEATKELQQAKQLLGNLNRVVDLLGQYEAAGRLDQQKAQQLQNARYTQELEETHRLQLEEELAHLTEKSQQVGYGTIKVRGSIAPGVRIVIGPFQLPVQSLLVRPRVYRDENGIQVTTLA